MALIDGVNEIKYEALALLEQIRESFENANLDTEDALTLKSIYSSISQEVLGLSYDKLVQARALPPLSTTNLEDEKRLGLIRLAILGSLFFPSDVPTNNLRTLQEAYLVLNEDLSLVSSRLDIHPPVDNASSGFDAAMNKIVIQALPARNAAGLPKSRGELASELGTSNFEFFTFNNISQLYFIVLPEFAGLNSDLRVLARKAGLNTDQIAVRVIWYGSINASSFNFAKMRVNLGMSSSQIRATSFGDDIATSSSSLFRNLLEAMAGDLRSAQGRNISIENLLGSLGAMQNKALTFLAQVSSGSTLIENNDVINEARAAGVSDSNLETSLQTRDDNSFLGADFLSNSLFSSVFPASSNDSQVLTLNRALQQDPDSFRYTNLALNQAVDTRKLMVTAAKRLLASIEAHKIVIQRPTATATTIAQALDAIEIDLIALEEAYDTFLNPVNDSARVPGSRTTESANFLLTKAVDFTKSLRIEDQIASFPLDFDFQVDPPLQAVLDSLTSCVSAIHSYFVLFKIGRIREFLDTIVSISSVNNFILADGEPASSIIISEFPQMADKLSTSVKQNILDKEGTEEIYHSISLQVEEFASILRGGKTSDPVGKLFDLPISILDAVLPNPNLPNAYSVDLEADQEGALRQLRASFVALRNTIVATIRDLGAYGTNLGCGFNDAKFLVTKLSGASVSSLITELKQA